MKKTRERAQKDINYQEVVQRETPQTLIIYSCHQLPPFDWWLGSALLPTQTHPEYQTQYRDTPEKRVLVDRRPLAGKRPFSEWEREDVPVAHCGAATVSENDKKKYPIIAAVKFLTREKKKEKIR